MTGRVLAAAVVLVVALLVSTVLLPTVAVAGWRPDVVALSVVAFALARGSDGGARYGFCAGLAADLLSGADALVGLSALVLTVVGYGAGLARPYLPSVGLAGLVLVAAAGGALSVVGAAVVGGLLGSAPLPAPEVATGTLVVALSSALLAPVVCPAVTALTRRVGARS